MNIKEFFRYLVEREGSDIHLCAGRRPHIRIHGELFNTELDLLKPDQVKNTIYSILSEEQIKTFEKENELDVSYMLPDISRFRINIYKQRGTLGIVIRAIPFQVEPFEILGIPNEIKNLADSLNGLILVTGPQGSGKTTTLAALVDHINTTRKAHIITIEDPIEYVHRSKKSIINQREVGRDTNSYYAAMKYILRQDSDVCLIGEIRDVDSVYTALSLAEAGVLVLSTLHSPNAVKAISRIIDMFDKTSRNRVRTQVSLALRAVISQQLVACKDKKGRALACEIMQMTHSIENLIRTDGIKQIGSVIQTSKAEGMCTMDQSLYDLYLKGIISKYELLRRASEVKQMKRQIREMEAA